tara:strand:+ start:469 stop:642 length:174 start_codon:yes stop_codon:yes gene_type:complete
MKYNKLTGSRSRRYKKNLLLLRFFAESRSVIQGKSADILEKSEAAVSPFLKWHIKKR